MPNHTTAYSIFIEGALDYRNESRILYLRNFNNWIKSILIRNTITDVLRQYKKIQVLDLGSGKGGDQIKWAKAGVSHVSFMDNIEASICESQKRYRKSGYQYNADFYVHDFTHGFTDILSNKQYHLISCQFSLHYCFESYNQAVTTVASVAASLLPGGFFIGTIVNALELAKRLHKSDGISFGNDLYKVTFANDKMVQKKLFGEKYNFYLEGSVDCSQFLVYPALLDKMASENGMRMVSRVSFPQFYRDNLDTENGRILLSHIKALQEFYVTELDHLSKNEFAEVKKYDDDSLYNKVQTISASEWSIIGMYDVFVYQKM